MNASLYSFKNKKVTVMGLGILGGGLGTVSYLCQRKAIVTVTDLKSESELRPTLNVLNSYKNIHYVLGKHRDEDFINADMIIRNPAVRYASPFLEIARRHKIPVHTAESLFMKIAPSSCTIIGITGTRGKSTTSMLIYTMLQQTNKKCFLGGNMYGYSTLPILNTLTADSFVVLELSSWQLSSFGDHKVSPDISIITNIYEDHLNFYRSMEEYVNDKTNIFAFQTNDDILILNKNQKISKLFAKKTRSNVTYFNASDFPDTIHLWNNADHNKENAQAVITVGKLLGIPVSNIVKSIESFTGLPGRLEKLGKIQHHTIVNDATSTTPISCIKAIESLSGKSFILIAGGSSKDLDLAELAKKIKKYCKHVIFLPGEGTKLLSAFFNTTTTCTSVQSALDKALQLASDNDVILFSPAFPSFSTFANEFDRESQFRHAVQTHPQFKKI